MYDAVIIGAGVVGAAVARELARYELNVAVFEKAGDVCNGASKSNSATVHSGHDAAFGTKKAYYNVRGNQMYDRLCAELKVPFVRNGTIVFYTEPTEHAEIVHLKENADRNCIPGVRVLDAEMLRQVEPGFGPEVLGALYAPTGGMVSPHKLVIALCENAAVNGVEFHLGEAVNMIERIGDVYHLHTAQGIHAAAYVFNCAGVNADIFNNMVSERKLTMQPRKGEHIVLDEQYAPFVRATICQTPHLLPDGGHTKGMGLMPALGGGIILGCTSYGTERNDLTSSTAAGLDEIIDYFQKNWRHFPIGRHVPDFPVSGVIRSFSGTRAHLFTDDYEIGECPDASGFFNAVGIESPGLTAAPAIARALVQEAAARYAFQAKKDFCPTRAQARPFREMSFEEKGEAISKNPDYARIVCRCEQVTEAEVRDCIRGPVGARTVNAVKLRTSAGMGRCQGGFCGPEIVRILAEELHVTPLSITLDGEHTELLLGRVCE